MDHPGSQPGSSQAPAGGRRPTPVDLHCKTQPLYYLKVTVQISGALQSEDPPPPFNATSRQPLRRRGQRRAKFHQYSVQVGDRFRSSDTSFEQSFGRSPISGTFISKRNMATLLVWGYKTSKKQLGPLLSLTDAVSFRGFYYLPYSLPAVS